MYNRLLILGLIAAAVVAAVGLLYRTSEGITRERLSQYATTTFAVAYPYGYTVDEHYTKDIAPGRVSQGVKFTISPERAAGTNLSPDSYVSVEWLPTLVSCSATPYLYDPVSPPTLQDEGRAYSVAYASGAAAGNFYEETVYTRLGDKGCVAVRYVIHSTNLGNYDPGTVRRFDKESLLREFDGVRRSLRLN